MAKVDNDATKHLAQPFVIVAQRRSGGTFMSHCLSNHPQVFCDRAESIHHKSVWRRYNNQAPATAVLEMLTHQEGYHASGCKLVYDQAFERKMWPKIMEIRARIIHLTRENKLRQAVSICFNQKVRKDKAPYFPLHSTEETGAIIPVHIDPRHVIHKIKWMEQREARYTRILNECGLKVYHMTYTDMVNREGKTAHTMNKTTAGMLCDFLGVRRMPLRCELKRVHNHPLSEWIENYDEFIKVISKSEYARFLDEERAWEE